MDSISSSTPAKQVLARLPSLYLVKLVVLVMIWLFVTNFPAMAAGVTYTFSGANSAPGGDGLSVAFSYTAPTFVTSSTSLLSSQLSSCTNCLVSTEVPAVVFHPANAGRDTIDFADTNNTGSAYAFPVGALKTPGTYTSSAPFNPGTLTVTLVTSPTIHVPGDQPSIQAAINAATNGYIVLVAPGTYTENINFLGKAITVTSANGPATTIIDGGLAGTVVTFNTGEGADSVLSGFTIRNGRSTNWAGGIQITGSSPTITGNTITANQAPVGLGIYINGGSPTIKNNLITGNSTQYGDGAQGGGGILVEAGETSPSSPLILGNTITNNSVAIGGNGGGISVGYFSSPTIEGNLIGGNTAYNNGGGIAVQNYNGAAIVQNVIVNNASLSGGSGAGLYLSTSPGAVSTVEGNTIVANRAFDNTSGIYTSYFVQLATFTNNIVIALPGQNAVTCTTYGTQASFFFNDLLSSGGQSSSGPCSSGGTGNISADPLFVNLSVGNFHLQPGSPAINAGTTGVAQLPTTDFDGDTRIVGTTLDLGAYEYQGLTSTQLSSPNLNFSSQTVGVSSSPLPLQITNTGSTVLQISNISPSSYFSQTNNCLAAAGIAVGQSCNINVVFTPLLPGPQSGQLTITSNVGGSPQSVPLSGTGFSIAAVVNSPAFGTLRNNFSGWVGMKLTVGNSLLSVTALGRIFAPGNSSSHVVKIVDASTGKDVPGASANVLMAGGSVGNFVYANLPASVVLNPNSGYYILSRETQGGDQWYDLNTTIQTTSDWTDVSAVWSADGAIYNSLGGIDRSYVPVAFLYNVGIIPSSPVISQQPQNQIVSTNGTATFAVAATGGNLTYQWWSAPAGSSTFSQIDGATSSIYAISPAIQADSGEQFECVITNNLGAATSNPALLTILNFTNYVTSVHLGATRSNYTGWVGMSVTVGNAPITVVGLGRMFAPGNTGNHTVEIVNAANGQVVSGGFASVSTSGGTAGAFVYADFPAPVTLNANTTYYILSQETQSGDQWYDLNTSVQASNVASQLGGVYSSDGISFVPIGSVGNSYGPVDFLYTENITTPMITAQPQSASVNAGATVTFSVTATGGGLSYQWWSAPPGGTGHSFTQIPGATGSTYTIPSVQFSDSGDQYLCVVTNADGYLPSNIATLTVVPSLPIPSYVTSSSLGSLRSNYTGWVGMRISVGSTSITVAALGRMVAPGNSGSHALEIVNAANGQVLSGAFATVSMSGSAPGAFVYGALQNNVTLSANTAYYIVSQEFSGGDQWYDLNTTIQTVNMASEASGVYSFDGINFIPIGSAGNSYGPVDFLYTESITTLTVTSHPQSVTVAAGAPATFSFTATGGALSYQWQIQLAGTGTFVNIQGAISSSYTMASPALSDSGDQFQCVVTNPLGSATSGIATLTVTPVVPGTPFIVSNTLGSIRNNYTGYVGMKIVTGSSPVTVTSLGRIFAPGNTGSHQIKIVDASLGSDEDSGNFYWVNHPGIDVPGGSVTVSMTGGTLNSFVYAPLAVPVVLNPNSSYYILALEADGGDSWYDHDGTIAQTTSVAAITNAAFGTASPYGLKNNSPSQSYVPVNFQYTLEPTSPGITQQPVNASVALGGTAVFTVMANGSNLRYQWQSMAPGAAAFIAIPAATNASYSTPPVSPSDYGTLFQSVVSNSVGSVTTNAATLVAPPIGTEYVTSETVGTLRNDFSGWVGTKITTGNSPITISALGRFALTGNTGTHALKIVDSSGHDVAGGSSTVAMAGAAAGGFAYALLPSPIALDANSTYFIVSLETAGGDQWYDYNTLVNTTGVAAASGAVYSSGTGYVALGSNGQSYGPLSFLY